MKEYSILELQSLMENGDLTSTEIVQADLERIKEIDSNDP